MKLILKDLDLPFYDPMMIIEKMPGTVFLSTCYTGIV